MTSELLLHLFGIFCIDLLFNCHNVGEEQVLSRRDLIMCYLCLEGLHDLHGEGPP